MEDKKYNYYGRYSHATGFFTAPDGKRYKCSWQDYLDWVGKHRGLEVARRIERRYQVRQANSKSKKGQIGGLKIATYKSKDES